MKSILVALNDIQALPSLLTTAYLVARRFGSHIEGLNLRPVVRVGRVSAGTAMPEMLHRLELVEHENSRRMREPFEAFMREHGVAMGEAPASNNDPSAGWTEEVDHGGDVVGDRGRLFDLVVVGRPREGASHPTVKALESALFGSGRPLLVAPPAPPASIGSSVTIAWNDSTEAARALAGALPLLRVADRVAVLTVAENLAREARPQSVIRFLQRHGIAAEAAVVPADGRTVGAALLAESAKRGADLLVMGAYTHSRLRELIFGGATEHILHTAELPVLMAH